MHAADISLFQRTASFGRAMRPPMVHWVLSVNCRCVMQFKHRRRDVRKVGPQVLLSCVKIKWRQHRKVSDTRLTDLSNFSDRTPSAGLPNPPITGIAPLTIPSSRLMFQERGLEQGWRLNPLLQQPCTSFPHARISARVRANSAGGK
jgi:hypothetical protein